MLVLWEQPAWLQGLGAVEPPSSVCRRPPPFCEVTIFPFLIFAGLSSEIEVRHSTLDGIADAARERSSGSRPLAKSLSWPHELHSSVFGTACVA